MVLQAWGLPAGKGLYSAIYGGRGQGGLGWETLAQGTALWGQTEKALATFVVSPTNRWEIECLRGLASGMEGAGVRNSQVRTTVL